MIEFPDEDRAPLTNEDITEESLVFEEGLPSGTNMKLGLCDAATLEFECRKEVGNLNKKRIQASIGVMNDEGEFEYIPLGVFFVDSSKIQSDEVSRKIIAYDQASSVYEKSIVSSYTPGSSYKYGRSDLESLKRYICEQESVSYDINTTNYFLVNNSLPRSSIKFNVNVYPKSMYDYETTESIGMSGWVSEFVAFKKPEYLLGIRIKYITVELDPGARDYGDTFFFNNTINERNIEKLYNEVYNALPNGAGRDYTYNSMREILKNSYFDPYPIVSYEFYTTNPNDTDSKVKYWQPIYKTYIKDESPFFYPYIKKAPWLIADKKIRPGVLDYSVPHRVRIRIPISYVVEKASVDIQNDWVTLLPNSINIAYGRNVLNDEPVIYSVKDTNLQPDEEGYYAAIDIFDPTDPGNLDWRDYIYLVDPKSDILTDYNEFKSSELEIDGYFARYNRVGLYEKFMISDIEGLYPEETLYPSEDLYPQDPLGGYVDKSSYIECERDDFYRYKYGSIRTTTIDEYGNDSEFIYPIVFAKGTNLAAYPSPVRSTAIFVDDYNEDDYNVYELDNVFISSAQLEEEDLYQRLQPIANALRRMKYVESNVELLARPWIQSGDIVNVPTKDGGFNILVMKRRMTGIDFLVDEYEAY